MTKKKLGGYAIRQELTRARNANRAARGALDRILEAQQMTQTMYLLISKAALALGTNLDALEEIGRISQEAGKE